MNQNQDRPFFKGYIDLFSRTDLTVHDKVLVSYLGSLSSNCWEVFPSINHLASKLNFGEKTVRNSIKNLTRLGYIRKIRVGKKCNNRYVVDMNGPQTATILKAQEVLRRDELDATTEEDIDQLITAEKAAYESTNQPHNQPEAELDESSIL